MRVTSSMTSLVNGHLLDFLMSFFPFPPTQRAPTTEILYGNDHKSHADLLIYKSEKMSLFDQKILEVANRISFNFSVEYSISREFTGCR